MDLASIVLRLEAQTADYQKKLDGATTRLKRFESDTKKSLGSIESTGKNLGNSLKTFFTVGAIVGTIRKVSGATSEAQDVQAQLEAAVASTGRAAGFAAPELLKMASALQDVSTYDDEAIAGMSSLLLSFDRIRGPQFVRAQSAILDLATRLRQDLPSAARTVGKALNDPINGMGALQKAGIKLTDTQKDLIKEMVTVGNVAGAQGVILTEIEKRFGGAAAAARNTFGGALSALKNTIGDLLEQNDGLPAATAAIKEITSTLKDPGVKAGADALFSTLITGLSKYVELVTKGAAGWKVILSGRGGNDAVDVDSQIAALKSQRDQIKFTQPGSFEEKRVGELNAQIAELEARFWGVTDGALNFDGSIKEVEVTAKRVAAAVTELGEKVDAVGATFGSRAQDASNALSENLISAADLEGTRFDQFGKNFEQALQDTTDGILKDTTEALGKYTDTYTVFLDEASRNTQSIIADTLTSGFDNGFDGVLKSFGKMLVSITAQIVAADLGKRLFGDVQANGNVSGGWIGTAVSAIGTFFGGSRDSGGRGKPGVSYAIGTGAQPEVFTPDVPGTFTPANKAGGLSIQQSFVIQSNGGTVDRRTQLQIANEAARGVASAQRRNG